MSSFYSPNVIIGVIVMSFLWGLSPHIAKFAIQESPLPYIAIRQISAALIGTGLMGILVVSHFIKVPRNNSKVCCAYHQFFLLLN